MPVDLMSEPANPDESANVFGVRIAMSVVPLSGLSGKTDQTNVAITDFPEGTQGDGSVVHFANTRGRFYWHFSG